MENVNVNDINFCACIQSVKDFFGSERVVVRNNALDNSPIFHIKGVTTNEEATMVKSFFEKLGKCKCAKL